MVFWVGCVELKELWYFCGIKGWVVVVDDDFFFCDWVYFLCEFEGFVSGWYWVSVCFVVGVVEMIVCSIGWCGCVDIDLGFCVCFWCLYVCVGFCVEIGFVDVL